MARLLFLGACICAHELLPSVNFDPFSLQDVRDAVEELLLFLGLGAQCVD